MSSIYQFLLDFVYPAITGLLSYIVATVQSKNNLARSEAYQEKSDLINKCHELKRSCFDYWNNDSHDEKMANDAIKLNDEILTRLTLLKDKFKLDADVLSNLEQSGVNMYDMRVLSK